MKNLNFRYYPAGVLFTLFCIIVAVNFLLRTLIAYYFDQPLTLWEEAALLLGSGGLVQFLFGQVNKYFMWNPYLKLLGLHDLRGNYAGELVSTFHINDDPQLGHVTKHLLVSISQNLNGIYLTGKVFNNTSDPTPTSTFSSGAADLVKLDDGSFQLSYTFTNNGNLQSAEHAKYGLQTHLGYTILYFNPQNRQLEGTYFTHERQSSGRIKLLPQP